MKILVTGATGFIGKHLTRRLLNDGYQVVCLVRTSKKAEDLAALGAEIFQGDVTDYSSVVTAMSGCEWVIHLANLYSMWVRDRKEFWRVNVEGTRNVMRAAVELGVKKCIYISTVAVYGKPKEIPFNEDSQPGPRLFSDYAKTKSVGDQIAWKAYHEDKLPLVVLYPGIVLGGGDDKASGQYIQTIIHKRTPSTIFHRSIAIYVYVEDVVEAILQAARRPETVGKRYLIGGTALDGKAYANLISEVSGVKLPWFHFPDAIVIAASYFLTGLAAFTHQSPNWGLTIDASWTLKNGFVFDGSRAERELEIKYTPIRVALAEAVTSYRIKD